MYMAFFKRIPSFKIHPNLLKSVLYFSHYLISSKFEAADEIMAKVLREMKMDFKPIYILKNLS